MKHAAIYARVSTVDRGQDPETQLRQLREYAGRRGFSLTREYVDHASGTRNDQAEYRAMLEDARKRRFDVLLVWRYDRFARSMRELVNALAEFEGLGIDFVSYNVTAVCGAPCGLADRRARADSLGPEPRPTSSRSCWPEPGRPHGHACA
jgi:DNA invertase Pin-like site-specific DNA recombinase